MEFLNAFFTAAFDNNIVFAQLIAIVSVILVAQRPQEAVRMGGLLGIAVAVAGLIGWPLMGAGKSSEERTRILRFCTVLACNAAVLAVPLANGAVADTLTFSSALGASLGAGFGLFLAVVLFAFVRNGIDERLVPHAPRGLPITLITASLMALAFTGVVGIAGGLFV